MTRCASLFDSERPAHLQGKVQVTRIRNVQIEDLLGRQPVILDEKQLDAKGFGMGTRSQRFALIAKDGKVEQLLVEPGPGLNVSSADSVLGKL